MFESRRACLKEDLFLGLKFEHHIKQKLQLKANAKDSGSM